MTPTARAYAASEPAVRARSAARSRSVSAAMRARSILCVTVAMELRLSVPAVALNDRWSRSTTAARHGGQDDEHVAIADGGVQPVQHAHVLVVEVDVHVAVQVPIGAEELALGLRVRARKRVQYLADVRALGSHLALAGHGRAERRWDADRRHAGEPAPRRRTRLRRPGRRPCPGR